MSDDAFDEALHDQLLSAITSGGLNVKTVKKQFEDVGAGELLNAIKSTKNIKESRTSISSKKTKKSAQSNGTTHKTLQAPLHRTEVEKIQRRIGFDELEKDLKVWEPVVSEHVHASNHQFPLNRESFNIQTAASRNEGFVARTPLEKAMDAVLATSKCNLANDQEYTQEEMEIIKAMDVAEAKEKLSKLRRLRALQSYQEAKFRRQGKIKSKNYHRIMKRAKRREELKELDELLVRDPEAARAKLEELDKDRIYERATLKHRSQNKMSKVLARHASKDPNAKKLLDDHIRFGKEMKEKIGIESEDEEGEGANSDVDNEKDTEDLIQDALEDVSKEMDDETARDKVKKMRMDEKKKAKEAKERGGGGKEIRVVELVPFDEEIKEMEGSHQIKDTNKRKADKDNECNGTSKKMKREDIEHIEAQDVGTHFDFDQAFDEVEKTINREGGKVREKKVKEKKEKPKKKEKNKMEENDEKVVDDDLILDPNNYLVSETNKVMVVGPDMDDGNDLIEDNTTKMGEAFVDDDVMAEFVDEKEEIEEMEKEKDVDLTLLGWGSWTGPGMSNKKKKKFVVKAAEKERRDKGKVGLIISEKRDKSMDSLQPKTVPFPFIRMKDYEASLSQPLGKEWNSLSSHSSLIKPTVSTQGGRVILPMSKKDVLKTKMEKAQEK